MNHELFWNTRYLDVGDDYLFGTDPSHFLEEREILFKAGESALLIADGEGRNSVWLAQKGLNVTAIDVSHAALEKARKLAQLKQVEIEFIQSDIFTHDWNTHRHSSKYDWVIGIFIQFAGGEAIKQQFQLMKDLTRLGGKVMLLGYTPKQLDYKTGGPSDVNNLYKAELLKDAFSDWVIDELIEYEKELFEGIGHSGRSALLGLVAKKS